jgi:hypothetical protein
VYVAFYCSEDSYFGLLGYDTVCSMVGGYQRLSQKTIKWMFHHFKY